MNGRFSVDVQEAGEGEQAPSGEPALVSFYPSARRKEMFYPFFTAQAR